MTMLRYNIHVGENGSILIPTTPFAAGDEIEVVLRGVNEEIEKMKPEQRMTSKISEREAAFDDFMTSWKGCLKGVPHMTAREIRAERLEKKYGQQRREE
jgi:hypothetical protein